MKKLFFGRGNAKLSKTIHTFSLPAGYSCPQANLCLSKANPITGTITDGPNTEFRCYAASQEALFTSVRNSRWTNLSILQECKTQDKMEKTILFSIPKTAKIVRLHVSGDFFNEKYFRAWMNVAKQKKDILFYGYTKCIETWVNNLHEYLSIPNFVLTASVGGKQDQLAKSYYFRMVKVVYSEEEAKFLNLEIDHDDSHAMVKNQNDFAVLIHGPQPAKSEASKALETLKKNGFMGYSRNKKIELSIVTT